MQVPCLERAATAWAGQKLELPAGMVRGPAQCTHASTADKASREDHARTLTRGHLCAHSPRQAPVDIARACARLHLDRGEVIKALTARR